MGLGRWVSAGGGCGVRIGVCRAGDGDTFLVCWFACGALVCWFGCGAFALGVALGVALGSSFIFTLRDSGATGVVVAASSLGVATLTRMDCAREPLRP